MLAYVRTYGVDACITRGANNYGPRQYPEKFMPLFITNAFDGEPLPVYGDGRQRREWLHADDYCSAIELVLREAPAGEIYNVGGQECENMEVVRRILDLTGASPDLVRHVADRPGHDRRYAVDSSKVRALGWTPAHSFKDGGLEETVDLVPRKPRVVGADQVRRVPRVLRAAVRRASRRLQAEPSGPTHAEAGRCRGRTSLRDAGGGLRRTLVRCRDGPARRGSGGSCRVSGGRQRLGCAAGRAADSRLDYDLGHAARP